MHIIRKSVLNIIFVEAKQKLRKVPQKEKKKEKTIESKNMKAVVGV